LLNTQGKNVKDKLTRLLVCGFVWDLYLVLGSGFEISVVLNDLLILLCIPSLGMDGFYWNGLGLVHENGLTECWLAMEEALVMLH
jgi:hypothetical protein